MKVLQVINTLGAGGAERLVSELSVQFAKMNVETHVYILKNSDKNFFNSYLEENNISYEFSKRKSLYDVRHIIDLIKKIINGKYNIIHAHLSFSLYYIAVARVFLNKEKYSFIYTEHNTSNRRRNIILFRIIELFAYKRYAKIICISKDTEFGLNRWIKSIAHKTITIYNGIDINKFQNAKKGNILAQFELDVNDKILLSIGGLTEQKNHQLLISALPLLGSDFKLFIVGRGPLEKKLKELVHQLKIPHQVIFIGIRYDIEVLYKSADLFVLPSKWEGFGLVAAEAMASGVPVLVSNVPGLSKVVGESGYFFKSGDIKDLTEKIKFIFYNPQEVSKKVEIARERVKLFSIEAMADKYLKTYKSLN